jgi:hypothetical protein
MKKGVLLGVLVLMVVAATAFVLIRHRIRHLTPRWTAAQAKQSARSELSSPEPGIPYADWRDNKSWRKTPEYKVVRDEIMGIADAGDAQEGYLTADQVEVLIKYMHSPHFFARAMAAVVAGEGRSDPARSALIPHLVGLLSDPVSSVRLDAAGALGSMGDKSVIPFLYPLLNDDRPPVVETAQRAISKLQAEETAPGK